MGWGDRSCDASIRQLQKGLPQVRLRQRAVVARVAFDDPNLVSCAGLVPVMRLAQDAGLGRGDVVTAGGAVQVTDVELVAFRDGQNVAETTALQVAA